MKGPDFLVGREKGKNHLVLPDETVSRRHVRFRVEEAAVTVEDMGTSNGTLLNGIKISGRTELRAGDEIQIGGTRMRFGSEEAAAESATRLESRAAIEERSVPVPEGPTTRRPRPAAQEPPPAARPLAAPAAREEARFERHLRAIEAEDRERELRASLLEEDLGQRAGAFQILVYGGLLLGGLALFAAVYFLALLFVAEG